MTLKVHVMVFGVALGLTSASRLVQANTAQPSRQVLTAAVNRYLADHGDLCVGKFTWPRVVTAEDRAANTNDAVQLPVLERLGLVESTDVSVEEAKAPAAGTTAPETGTPGSQPSADAARSEPAKQYSLTEKGRRYYLQKKRVTIGAHDRPVEHDADLCVASLTLDKIGRWSPPEQVHGHLETVVRYTYHVKAADWMADPQAREVFPVVDRIVRNDGNLLMSVTVRLQDGKWQPVLPTL
jgi:hypothetical protein